jgi:hypothetical protein
MPGMTTKGRLCKLIVLLAAFAPAAFCDLTTDQKVADFMQLTGLYAKNYVASDWVRDQFGLDLYDAKPWLDRVKASKDDLEFYDICVRYVASLRDSHDEFYLNSDFEANLPITADLYEGKFLIDSIDRARLSTADYRFNIGDEIVSVDGKGVTDLIDAYLPYAANGSGGATARRRLAAQVIYRRRQMFFPRAHEVGQTASVVVRDQSGTESTYALPWIKSGTPTLHIGPVTSPRLSRMTRTGSTNPAENGNPWGVWNGDPPASQPQTVPPYLTTLHNLRGSGIISGNGSARYGDFAPKFNPPPGFQLRAGSRQDDLFVSGTLPVGQHKVGFIRIPTMDAADQTSAFQQFGSEIAYFKANTDALVIDVMGNGGGDPCYVEMLARFLFPTPFRGIYAKLRPSQQDVYGVSTDLYAALASQAPQWIVDLETNYLTQMQSALSQDRGMTGSLPVCSIDSEQVSPATTRDGAVLAYNKPILLLVDDLTLSTAELLAMFMQDEGRGTVLGVRTAGGGGLAEIWQAGVYSEGSARITRSLFTRKRPVSTPGFPTVDHFENAGIYPDITAERQTRENLLTGGKPFVDAFTNAVAGLMDAH